MKTAIVTYSNGAVLNTSINGTTDTIKNYFKVGRAFNIGFIDDNIQTVISCEVKESEIECLIY